ncbi:glycyl radical protein [Thermodesulfobacteriota bacterium]
MNQRIEKLKEKIHPEKYPICTERARLFTEAFKAAEGEPRVIRRSKGLANILDNITIFIEDGELIVGNTASKSMGFEIVAESPGWSKEELEGLREEEGLIISEEDERAIETMNQYWRLDNTQYRTAKLIDDERLWPFYEAGIIVPQWKDRIEGSRLGSAQSGMGFGAVLFCIDYEKVLNEGLNQVITEAEQELKDIRFTNADAFKKADFLRATIIVHEAILRFIDRFAVLASEMASKESDPTRKQELERIAAACQWVPANPARGFYEAIQSFWFIFLMTASGTAGLGRFDQFMYPFFKADIEEVNITDEDVLELLQCLRIKLMQIQVTYTRSQRQKWSGNARWNNMVIGGVKRDGSDATNELSYLVLEAALRCRTPHHTITLRVHDNTPEELMLKAIEVVKTGIGMPAFIGDQSYIGYFRHYGVPIEDARDYYIGGCLEGQISGGKSRTLPCLMCIVPLIFDIFMHNGFNTRTQKQLGPKTGEIEDFKTFDAFLAAFKEQLAYFMSIVSEVENIWVKVRSEMLPNPIVSSLMYNGIKEGKDYIDRTFPFENINVINSVGMINVVDSLAAIKKLVYDEKRYGIGELKAALDANWQGNGYEEMRKAFMAAPKFGNDDDNVDAIAVDLYQFWADTAVTFDTVVGGKHKPAGISISAQWPGGALTGATPDGRYAGDVLADGAVSPAQGRDEKGPTAVLKSAMKMNQIPFQSTLLNMKFHPSALKEKEDMHKLSSLIRTYFSSGGKHIQLNVVGKETLLEAQEKPENYRDLIVRVAGYSAYFIQLGEGVQDDVIRRTEYQITA